MSKLTRPDVNSDSRYYPQENELVVKPHTWMFRRHPRTMDIGGHKLEVFGAIRKQFKKTNELQGTVKTKNLAEREVVHKQGYSIAEDLMGSTGSFRVPYWYTTEEDKSLWINPHYKHMKHYTDARAICDCGEAVHLSKEHSDCPEWDDEAEIRLKQVKLDILVKLLADYDLPFNLIERRLSMNKEECENLLGEVGLDFDRLKKAGQNKTTATWILLSERLGVGYDEISDAWGVSEDVIAARCMSEDPSIIPVDDWYSR